VLVTHRMAMLALVDRLVVMDRGRVVADGRRDDVLRALAQQQAQAQPGAPAPADASAPAANDVPARPAAARPTAGTNPAVADRVRGER
jgi:ABC-type glutathione transport system ATPase component